ncbi:MAG: hypothetical protein DHS20C06_02680 [Hyphobacterium sp.]|nr:MAG: hypothetical protein DHS20C06_02680 [Hyphobacterium sp.]
MKFIRRLFAALVSIGLFIFLTYVFAVFLNPVGQAGWITALVLIGGSAIAALLVYAWLAKPGRRMRLNPGIDAEGSAIGLGLTGVGMAGRRRRDDADPDDFGGRRDRQQDNGSDSDDGTGEIGDIG